MGKELKTFLQRKLNNQQAHKKMFNIISQEGNTNQNHEISYHTYIKRLTYKVLLKKPHNWWEYITLATSEKKKFLRKLETP